MTETVETVVSVNPGTVLGERFTIETPIGEGAMGTVYRARDGNTEKPAAVKVLHPMLMKSREYVTRFKREAHATSRFRHESAVRVLGTGETPDGLPYIAMELVEGKSLREVMDDDGPMAVGRACNLAQQLLRALGAAHQRGIVHRDMKPDNVRVAVDEDGIERAKVLDFGVAKFISDEAAELEGAVKTKTGMVLGTPKYMSPEQIRGDAVDGRSDLYAVGAILYEMVSGEPPFDAVDVFGFVAMHLKENVMPLTQRVPDRDIAPELDAAILHLLEKEPSARPADANTAADRIALFAVEDPRAGDKEKALLRGMGAVVAAGAVAGGVCFGVASDVAPAALAAGLGLGIGAALSAKLYPRPSIVGYAKRILIVAAAAVVLGIVSLVFPGSPGGYVTLGHCLAAVLAYAAYLVVWSSKLAWARCVASGIVAPLVAAILVPVRVVPEGDAQAYFVATLAARSEEVALAQVESAAVGSSVTALVTVALLFGLSSLLLPRPAAARF